MRPVEPCPGRRRIFRVTDVNECWRCNYDLHVCPGCGESIEHGESACEECLADLPGRGT